jgi:fatty-acyl-CoA synthase
MSSRAIGIGHHLERSLRSNAPRTALQVGDRHWTYRDLDERSARLANTLAASGLEAGDRVLVALGNHGEFVETLVGCLRAGFVPVPVNQMLSSHEVVRIAEGADPRAVVYAGELEAQLEHVDADAKLMLRAGDAGSATAWDYEHTLGAASSRWTGPTPAEDDLAVLLYTGGTTGSPKGVMHTHHGLGINALAQLLEAEIRRDERLVLTTPLSHAAGFFLLPALCRGAAGIVVPSFDPERVGRVFAEERGTWTYLVPTMLYRWLDAGIPERHDLGSLRTIVYGAAPIMASRLHDAVERHGPVFIQQYGQTEVPTFATALSKTDHQRAVDGDQRLLESSGTACALCEVGVVDDTGNLLERGEVGEIVTRSPYNMLGYRNADDATKAAFHGAWLRTGDVGTIDDEGYLFLLDRLKDIVISGGMNIYTREVEEQIQALPEVAQVAAFGVPDADWGERLEVALIPTSEHESGEGRFATAIAGVLGSYKRPKAVHVLDELPLTPFGKFDKKELRRRYSDA